MESILKDLRYAIRMLAKKPGFTLVVVLTLAMGIGANTTIFSLLNAVFLKPLPGESPERLVSLLVNSSDSSLNPSFSYPDYLDIRDQSRVFSGLAAYGTFIVSLYADDSTDAVGGEIVTGNYFNVLGIRPRLGRFFLPEEDSVPGRNAVLVLSHELWRERFDSDPQIVGKQLTLNGNPFEVIGVAPEGFNSALLGRSSQLWVPVMMQAQVSPPSASSRQLMGSADMLGERRTGWLRVVGRIRDGMNLEQSRAELEVIAPRIVQNSPQMSENDTLTVARLGDEPGLRAASVSIISVLFAVVAFVLLIACANVANLLLARAASRQKEVGIRLALGAGRRHLVRQFLIESLLLSISGGGAGLLLALWGSDLFYQFSIPQSLELGLDGRVLGFTLLVSIITAILFGLAPSWLAARTNVLDALKEETSAVAGGRRKNQLRSSLVVLQMALSFVLLVGAGLFLHTLRGLVSTDTGFDAEKVLVMTMDLDLRGHDEARGRSFYDQILDRVSTRPGVESASLARVVPLGGTSSRSASFPADRPPQPGARATEVHTNIVGLNYFPTMGIPLVRGRDFDIRDREGSLSVAIVNQALARQFWPDQDPIGKRIMWNAGSSESEIVGVVSDIRHVSLRDSGVPILYLPLSQQYAERMALHVRADADPAALIGSVRGEIESLDPLLPVLSIRTLSEQVGLSVADDRLIAVLIAIFGTLALALAAVGLYGVMAYSVNQRTREIGIRIALGAVRRDIFRLVIGRALWLAFIGIGVGLAGSFVLTRFLSSLLFGVSATDPLTFTGVAVLLAIVTLLAGYIPARRAARVDPMEALRYE